MKTFLVDITYILTGEPYTTTLTVKDENNEYAELEGMRQIWANIPCAGIIAVKARREPQIMSGEETAHIRASMA